jgi:hypothetical protein
MTALHDAARTLVGEMTKAVQVSRSAGGSGISHTVVAGWTDRLDALIAGGGWSEIVRDAERWRAYERELPVSASTVASFIDRRIAATPPTTTEEG